MKRVGGIHRWEGQWWGGWLEIGPCAVSAFVKQKSGTMAWNLKRLSIWNKTPYFIPKWVQGAGGLKGPSVFYNHHPSTNQTIYRWTNLQQPESSCLLRDWPSVHHWECGSPPSVSPTALASWWRSWPPKSQVALLSPLLCIWDWLWCYWRQKDSDFILHTFYFLRVSVIKRKASQWMVSGLSSSSKIL